MLQGGVHGRARFECTYHRPAQRRSSGRNLMHHLLILHSSRRCAPETLQSVWTAARARTAFRKRAS
eukprot:1519314-Prymnesium_polylepis.1